MEQVPAEQPPDAVPPDAVPPPWRCRLRALVRVGVARWHITGLAVVAYTETPVGPYGEALLAELRPPLRLTVPWIVVDSASSQAAGRQHWGLPKEQAHVTLDLEALSAGVGPAPDELAVAAEAFGPRLPVLGAAVLRQPGRAGAPLLFRGRAQAARVRAVGGPTPGAGPGVVLDGVLHLGAPWRGGRSRGVGPGDRRTSSVTGRQARRPPTASRSTVHPSGAAADRELS